MKSRSPTEIRATPADKVIQRTLLSVQTVSKAGWRAATPYIWRTLRFKSEDDYHSFFAPISRLLKQTTAREGFTRRNQATSLIRDGDYLPEDLCRFFQSAEWTRSIVFDASPSREHFDHIGLAGDIAMQKFRKRRAYIGKEITVHLDGVCAAMGNTDWPGFDIEPLHCFLRQCKLNTFEIWNPPGFDVWTFSKFWTNYNMLRRKRDELPPLVVHDILTGRLGNIPYHAHGDLTIWLHPDWKQLDAETPAGDLDLAGDVGFYMYHVLSHKYDDRRLAVWGWLGCSCLCNASICREHDARGIIGEISDHARANFERNGTASGAANDMIQAFLDEGRLKICPTPCAAYEGWKCRDSEWTAAQGMVSGLVADMFASLRDRLLVHSLVDL